MLSYVERVTAIQYHKGKPSTVLYGSEPLDAIIGNLKSENKGNLMSFKKKGITVKCPVCQKEIYVPPSRLAQGRGKYCSKACSGKANSTKHGHSSHNSQSRTYNTWSCMKARCQNPNNPKYYMYGAIGITICDKWKTFTGFLEDMGERPENTTLDRIDGSKGYFKENCRWSSPSEQQNNIKTNTVVFYKGEQYLLSDLSKKLGIPKPTLDYRIKKGWHENDYTIPPKLGNKILSQK